MARATHVSRHVQPANPWKWTTILLGAVIGAVLVVGVVTAYFAGPGEDAEEASAQKTEQVSVVTAAPAAPARPSSGDIATCNNYAASAPSNRTNEALRNGLIGGAIGAGVGAATGAIADGGKGAGRGAGIGAIVGATAGTLYGLNKANQNNANAEAAYRSCMASRGY